MSTRSLVGGMTDGGTYVVYVHNDGDPDYRLPVLEQLIERDGAAKVLGTILSARTGGWSYLRAAQHEDLRNHLDDRGKVVPGYGLQYTDAPEATPLRFPEAYEQDSWIDYVYLIDESGLVRHAETQRDVPSTAWSWREHQVPVPNA